MTGCGLSSLRMAVSGRGMEGGGDESEGRDASVSVSPMVVDVRPSSLGDLWSPKARAARAPPASDCRSEGEPGWAPPFSLPRACGLSAPFAPNSSQSAMISDSSIELSVSGLLEISSESLGNASWPAMVAISGRLPLSMIPIRTASPWLGRTLCRRLVFPLRGLGGGLT